MKNSTFTSEFRVLIEHSSRIFYPSLISTYPGRKFALLSQDRFVGASTWRPRELKWKLKRLFNSSLKTNEIVFNIKNRDYRILRAELVQWNRFQRSERVLKIATFVQHFKHDSVIPFVHEGSNNCITAKLSRLHNPCHSAQFSPHLRPSQPPILFDFVLGLERANGERSDYGEHGTDSLYPRSPVGFFQANREAYQYQIYRKPDNKHPGQQPTVVQKIDEFFHPKILARPKTVLVIDATIERLQTLVPRYQQ